MTPWFSVEVAPFFSLLSLLAVVSVLERYAKQGRYRSAVITTYAAGVGLGGLLVLAALVALVLGQPRYVQGTLAFTGSIVGVVFATAIRQVRRAYTHAELRRTVATDL